MIHDQQTVSCRAHIAENWPCATMTNRREERNPRKKILSEGSRGKGAATTSCRQKPPHKFTLMHSGRRKRGTILNLTDRVEERGRHDRALPAVQPEKRRKGGKDLNLKTTRLKEGQTLFWSWKGMGRMIRL